MNVNVISKVNELIRSDEKFALVTITKSIGSAPGRTGNMMIVHEDGKTYGTVGGGKVEYTTIQEAVECIKKGTHKSFAFSLDEIGMICGGAVEGFIDVMKNDGVVIVGGGHVGLELYKIVNQLGYSVTVIDDRAEFANNERFPEARVLHGEYVEVLNQINLTDKYVVLVTKGHASDYEALKGCLGKDYKYLGLIGSKKKVLSLYDDLKNEGIDMNQYPNVYAPIGINIARNEPAEIAVSIVAEILKIRNEGKLEHLRIGK